LHYSIDDNSARSYIDVKYYGRINDQVVVEQLEEMILSPGFTTKDQLTDWSEVTDFAVTANGIERCTRVIRKRYAIGDVRKNRKIVFVVPQDIEQLVSGLAGIYQRKMGKVNIKHAPKFRMFRHRTEAFEWLRDLDLTLPHCINSSFDGIAI